MFRIKQKCLSSAIDSVTSSTTDLSRLTNHPKCHSPVISLTSSDRAKMPVLEGDLPPSQVLLINRASVPPFVHIQENKIRVETLITPPHWQRLKSGAERFLK